MKNAINSAPVKLLRLTVETAAKWKLKQYGVEYAEGLRLYGAPVVSVAKDSQISIGKRVVLCSWSTYTALGVHHAVILRTLAPGAQLIIGDDVGMSGATVCAAKKVLIGAKTMLGANVTITDTDFHSLSSQNRRYDSDPERVGSKEIVIGENVFVGTNSVILKGVHIGDNSVIGAGSIVTGAIPANVVAAGNPCRPLTNSSASMGA